MAQETQKSRLNEFLREHKSPNDPSHSHVSMGIPKGVYSIGIDIKEFWNRYNKALELKQPIYLAENPGKEIPVLVDIDLRVKKKNLPKTYRFPQPVYSLTQIKQIIIAYNRAITEVIDNPCNSVYTCVLLEKDPIEIEICGEKYIKNGFHLHFPKIFIEKTIQKVYLMPIVKKYIIGIFDNLQVTEILDTNVVNVHWLMYGSSKNNGCPYIATKCYIRNPDSTGKNGNGKNITNMVHECIETDFETALGDYIVNKHEDETMEEIQCYGKVMEMLPRILSISLYNRASFYYYTPKSTINTPLFIEFQKIKEKRKEYDQLSVDETLAQAQELLKMMNISRANDRHTWLRFGYCLWNITQGDDDGLTTWLEFSEMGDTFNESECLSLWHEDMRPNKYSLGTLRHYAALDNKEAYEAFANKKTQILEAMDGCHADVARVLYNEYGGEFVCTSIKNKEWYQFKNHIWRSIDSGVDLRARISCNEGIIIKQLIKKKREIQNQLALAEEADDRKILEKKLTHITTLVKRCKSTPFKNHVMIECQEIFYNDQFDKLLNMDPYLVAFQNGIYDFKSTIFRDGNPEDYLSNSIPLDYFDYGTIDHPKVMQVDDFFQKVFPDPDIREYFLDQACRVFVGGNPNKVMLFWTGTGNNGKTVTQTLFEKMLGKLAIKFNTCVITGKKPKAGAANPELARSGDGVRWVVMEEPDPDESINIGNIKLFTGGDSYLGRDLFEKGKKMREINPMFKFVLICNKLPTIKNADAAFWARVRVIPFESKFLLDTDCPTDYEEQVIQKKFPMDKQFAEKIPQLIQPLAWYLIQRWKTIRYFEQGEPLKVRVATERYRQNNDIFRQFAQQCVFDKDGERLTVTTLYMYFKDWFKDECPTQTIPTRSNIKQHYSFVWGEPIDGRFWQDKTCNQPQENIREIRRVVINPLL